MTRPQVIVTAAALGLTALSAGCTLPPYTVPEQNVTIPYSQFIPQAANNVTLPLLPAFSDVQVPTTTIPMPKEAQALNVTALTLNLRMQDNGPMPLGVKIYLAPQGTDPYSTPPLGGDAINLTANGPEVDQHLTIDPTLLKQSNLTLGVKVSSPGTTSPVTFQSTNSVVVYYSETAQIKLF